VLLALYALSATLGGLRPEGWWLVGLIGFAVFASGVAAGKQLGLLRARRRLRRLRSLTETRLAD